MGGNCNFPGQSQAFYADAKPFTIFAGSLKRIDSSVAGFSRIAVGSIPMTQILGANQSRYGLYIDLDFGGGFVILISTIQTPGGYSSCFVADNNSQKLRAELQSGIIIQSGFYACYEALADLQKDAVILTGWELIKS